MSRRTPSGQRPYQLSLRRLLLSVAVLSVFMAIAADVKRRCERVATLTDRDNSYSEASQQAAEREGAWLIEEVALLGGGLGLWLAVRAGQFLACPGGR